MTTSPFSVDGRPGRGPGAPAIEDASLDTAHDHVLRLVGDPATTARVIADVALRGAARAQEHASATSRTALLRAAHARLVADDRHPPSDELVDRLSGRAPMDRVLVRALGAAELTGAAVLDLTTRHGFDVRDAASIVGIDRATAATARTDAMAVVRAHLADAGADLEVDVPAALARLPLTPAPDSLHQLLRRPGDPGTRSVHPVLAWTASAAVILATVAGVGVALPQLADADIADAPVVTAEAVEEAPATRELATGDAEDTEVEELVVQPPERAEAPSDTNAAGTDAEQPAPEPAPTGADSSPAPEPEPEPTTPPDDAETAPEPEPEPEPSEGPLDVDLPGSP